MMNKTTARAARFSALSILLASGLAIAAPPAPPTPPTDSPLRGPSVDDRDVPGHRVAFGEGEDKRMRAARVPMRVFFGAIKMLGGEDAPADLRLTGAQQEELKAIGQELRETTRALARERRGERGENGERPGRGARKGEPRPDAAGAPGEGRNRERVRRGRGGADAQVDEMAPRDVRRERVRAQRMERAQVMEDGVKDARGKERARKDRAEAMMKFEPPAEVEALRVRAWEVLTEPQQEFVRAEITLQMEEIRAKREALKNGKRDAPRDGVQGKKRPGGDDRARKRAAQMSPEQILAKIEQLPPERRERALERFRRYLEQQEEAGKPAPDMDEVDVPTP